MIKRQRIFCVVLFFLSLSLSVASGKTVSTKEDSLTVAIDRAIDSAIEEKRIVGCVVLVSQDGKIVYKRAAGLGDREKKMPMREDAIFRLASVSKAFTSMAAAVLIDKGKLGLDDPVTKYLPDFKPKLADGTTPTITVRQLMSHTSGLNYSFFEQKDGPYHKAGVSDGLDGSALTLEENLRRIASAGLLFEPGTKWQYSLATDVLGAVVAKANGTTLPEAMRQHVTEPLKMRYAGFHLDESLKNTDRLPTPYYNGENEPIRMSEPQEYNGIVYSPNRIFDTKAYPSGGGGMAGTAEDVLLLLEAIRKRELVGPKILFEMDRDQTGGKGPRPGIGFGLGWSVVLDPEAAKTPQSKGTIAWSGAYGHHWFVDRERDLSVVIMTNTAFEGMNGKVTTDIRDAVYENVFSNLDLANVRNVVHFKPDTTTVLRNPLTGWGLYADIVWDYPEPEKWWAGLEPGVSKATHFYHRCRWSTLEPEEGKYAWKHDTRFRKMIEEAKKRGLKLGFRVIVNSQDNSEQATPDYVRKSGAKGTPCASNKEFWNPDITDPIFQEKFAAFVHAFGKEFDDPDIVDFVDGNGLGWWGEQHHLGLNEEQKEQVLEWICSTYASAFKRVLLVYCFGSEFGLDRELRIAVKKYGYIPRRDGIGSRWFTEPQKEFVARHFPDFPLVGESCYWSLAWNEAWKGDSVMKFQSVRDVLERSVADAIDGHGNTFDLRNPADLKIWQEHGPDLIEKFIAQGGYRLLPDRVDYPKTVEAGKREKYVHRWINVGCGVCPNANVRWNKKYRVAFSLLSLNDTKITVEGVPVAIHVDPAAEPSRWIKDKPGEYKTELTWNVPSGRYRLAAGIVDTTKNDKPGIFCAVHGSSHKDGWVEIGEIQIK